MANAYDSGTGYFNIDTDVDEAGLDTLKGSEIGSGDTVYVSNAATVTMSSARNTSIKEFYTGDNSTGTAVTKRGTVYVTTAKSGYTITLYNTTTHGGLNGTGSTSQYKITGADSANRVTIRANTGAKCSDNNVRLCAQEYQHVVFEQFVCLYEYNVGTIFNDVVIDGNNVTSTSGLALLLAPAVFKDVEIKRVASSVFIESWPLTEPAMSRILQNLKVTYTVNSNRSFFFYQNNSTKYYRITRLSGAITDRSRHFRR